MTDLRKAAEMALEALCSANPIGHALEDYEYHNKATETLRQALAQPKQKPVAWMVLTKDDKKLMLFGEEKPPTFNTPVKLIPLYTAPPSKPWVSLTDEDFDNIYKRYDTYDLFARAIEAKLKERNT